jgi:hypothetical protein
VNEASGSLTAIVSSDVEAANGQPPLSFIVYVANSKGASKSSAISERVPLMQAVPIGAQRMLDGLRDTVMFCMDLSLMERPPSCMKALQISLIGDGFGTSLKSIM